MCVCVCVSVCMCECEVGVKIDDNTDRWLFLVSTKHKKLFR